MGSVLSSLQSIPPLRSFILPTPETSAILLNIFQYFPVATTIQWILSYHPAGKTSLKNHPLNLPGRLAWSIMELTGPLNLLYILYSTLSSDFFSDPTLSMLPVVNRVVAGLYVAHYANRAVISPFFAAPSMSPIHVNVVLAAVGFNWMNSACLAAWVLGYGVEIDGHPAASAGFHSVRGAGAEGTNNGLAAMLLPCLGVVLFGLGMAGNIYSERALFALRREEGDKRAAKKHDTNSSSSSTSANITNQITTKDSNRYNKVYVIPPKRGVFASILYPHYVFEWLEWFGFALVGTAVYPTSSKLASVVTGMTAPRIRLAPWLRPFAGVAEALGVPLPLPALVFVVNAVANMLPHARWGRKWYIEKFGEEAVGNRGVAVPFCPWL